MINPAATAAINEYFCRRVIWLLHSRQDSRRNLHAVLQQQEMPHALALVNDQFLLARQHLLHRFEVQTGRGSLWCRTKGRLHRAETCRVSAGAIDPSEPVCAGT